MTNEMKEVAIVKQQTTKALAAAQALEIKTQEDMVGATDLLSKMKQVARMTKERKEAITKPLMEALNSARDLFKPIETNLAEAERTVKGKMLAYQDAAEKEAEEERLRLAKRVEKGTMKPETAVAKMEAIPETPRAVQGKVGATAFRTVKKVRFAPLTNQGIISPADLAALVNDGYVVWNETAARKDALAGKKIPGVEVYEEKVVASSSQLGADHPLLGQK